MADLLPSPWGNEFQRLLDTVESSLVLCAPYVGSGPCQLVVDRIERRGRSASIDVHILTDLSRDNLLSGVTDVASLLRLASAIPRTTIRFLPSLHAKVYIADESRAVITSSNLTHSGMLRNFEYGVSFDEPLTVAAVRADILRYSELGSPVDQIQLQTFVQITEELRDLSRTAQRSINLRLRREFDRRLAAADIEILRARAAGRTAHAIFADTILYLLRGGPMRTATSIKAFNVFIPTFVTIRLIELLTVTILARSGSTASALLKSICDARGELSELVTVGGLCPDDKRV